MLSRRMVIIVGVIVLVAVNVMVLAVTGKNKKRPGALSRFAIIVTAPVQKMITTGFKTTKNVWVHYFSLVSASKENDQLRRSLDLSNEKNNRFLEIELENERLRSLLGFQKKIKGDMIVAEVVAKDPSSWSKTIIVDKGFSHGVQKGMPVVIPDGIVGLVIEVSSNYSKILLMIDPNSAVDALVQKTRARGIVKGGEAGKCLFKYVLRKHDISAGDAVVSSGLDGVFPKGLRVGRISEIVKLTAGIFQEVAVTPYVDFETLEEVLILPLPPKPSF